MSRQSHGAPQLGNVVQVRFINSAGPHIGAEAAYAHGAHLVLLDGIGLGVGMPPQVSLPPPPSLSPLDLPDCPLCLPLLFPRHVCNAIYFEVQVVLSCPAITFCLIFFKSATGGCQALWEGVSADAVPGFKSTLYAFWGSVSTMYPSLHPFLTSKYQNCPHE